MALFGGQRDISLFRTLNRELINEIIDTEVVLAKLDLLSKMSYYRRRAAVKIFGTLASKEIVQRVVD